MSILISNENLYFIKSNAQSKIYESWMHFKTFVICFELLEERVFVWDSEYYNLFVTSKKRKHQFTNLKCCINVKEPLKSLFNGVWLLIYYFKSHFAALNSWIGEFMVSFSWCHERVNSATKEKKKKHQFASLYFS